ncbi:MAG: FKBP-type peptidyl-prolyl cis-trans isomerase [Planctomycetales bacterium]|nr:FKBP-type peptidyl-prolyl cis-trans isomerase [Planctomycetales bacterium]
MTDAQDKTDAAADPNSPAQKDPIGYFLGLAMGQQMNSQGLKADDFTKEAFAAGMKDGFAEANQFSDEELATIRTKLQDLMNSRFEERLAEAKKKGDAWLQKNLEEDGVKKLVGELQYKVIESGKGGSPGPSDTVKVHYTGKLINGNVFDSSVKRGEPAEFVVGQVIKGWQMALQKMKVGDKWMLYIPSEMAYGDRGSPPVIGPNEVLIFEVELLEIL